MAHPSYEIIGWVAFAIFTAASVFFSIIFTKLYEDHYETEILVTLTTIISLTLCVCTVTIVPVDVYLVSSTSNWISGTKFEWATPALINHMLFGVKTAYYVVFAIIAVLCFIVLPFVYFYYEEWDEEEGTVMKRSMAALKYTTLTIAILLALLMTGLLLKARTTDERTDMDWFRRLLTSSGAEKSLSFVIAALILFGMLIYISYTAYGLSALPFYFLKGTQSAESQRGDIESRLVEIRERTRAINGRYTSTNRTITKRDKKMLEDLARQERSLTRRSRVVEVESHTWWYKMGTMLRPFQILIGLAMLCVTWLIVVSLFLGSIDKVANSICGSDCGFILNNPQIYNPLSQIFLITERYFPIDYIVFILIVAYFFISTLYGIMRLGVRLLWVHLYQIKLGETPPQGLLLTTVILILSVLPLTYYTSVVAPQYATFGSQVYCTSSTGTCEATPDLIHPCSIDAPASLCTPTVLSNLLGQITFGNRFFGMVFYLFQWAFILIFLIGFAVSAIRSPPPPGTPTRAEEEEDDLVSPTDNERRPLLTGNGARVGSGIGGGNL
ncbi:hypothetical protein SeLEV6574_g01049 [Synchytrium endobioticum]|nr:hypothetical protein SeLEV6574_g01049 [Synchytrium endobioticum]